MTALCVLVLVAGSVYFVHEKLERDRIHSANVDLAAQFHAAEQAVAQQEPESTPAPTAEPTAAAVSSSVTTCSAVPFAPTGIDIVFQAPFSVVGLSVPQNHAHAKGKAQNRRIPVKDVSLLAAGERRCYNDILSYWACF